MVRGVRFLVGLAMVVVGVALSAPMATRVIGLLVTAASSEGTGQSVGAPGAAAWAGAPSGPVGAGSRASGGASSAGPAPTGAGAYCIPDPLRTDPVIGGAFQTPATEPPSVDPSLVAAATTGNGEGEGRLPSPPPPAPLPEPPADLSLAAPAFPPTYRSTLDVPPPPLLDVDAPSPLVMPAPAFDGRSASAVAVEADPANDVRATPVAFLARAADAGSGYAEARPAPRPETGTGGGVPGAWIVRDGDDLTNIATRLYGHPGAAEAIWNANRDRIVDPALLPIGTSLRVPPSWTPPQPRAAGGPATLEPVRRPGSVRVGPGESLETLAERFYGDRAWAERLWQANRDRLRNPSLVVPGMELRLP